MFQHPSAIMNTGLFHISEVLPLALSELRPAQAEGMPSPSVHNAQTFSHHPPSHPRRPVSMNGLLLSVMHHILLPR